MQWNPYRPGLDGAVNVAVRPASIVTSNPPAVVSAVTVCCAVVRFFTLTFAPATTADAANPNLPLPSLIVIAGLEAATADPGAPDRATELDVVADEPIEAGVE